MASSRWFIGGIAFCSYVCIGLAAVAVVLAMTLALLRLQQCQRATSLDRRVCRFSDVTAV
jgi:hypothetical protein